MGNELSGDELSDDEKQVSFSMGEEGQSYESTREERRRTFVNPEKQGEPAVRRDEGGEQGETGEYETTDDTNTTGGDAGLLYMWVRWIHDKPGQSVPIPFLSTDTVYHLKEKIVGAGMGIYARPAILRLENDNFGHVLQDNGANIVDALRVLNVENYNDPDNVVIVSAPSFEEEMKEREDAISSKLSFREQSKKKELDDFRRRGGENIKNALFENQESLRVKIRYLRSKGGGRPGEPRLHLKGQSLTYLEKEQAPGSVESKEQKEQEVFELPSKPPKEPDYSATQKLLEGFGIFKFSTNSGKSHARDLVLVNEDLDRDLAMTGALYIEKTDKRERDPKTRIQLYEIDKLIYGKKHETFEKGDALEFNDELCFSIRYTARGITKTLSFACRTRHEHTRLTQVLLNLTVKCDRLWMYEKYGVENDLPRTLSIRNEAEDPEAEEKKKKKKKKKRKKQEEE